jgi:hypothetical protein
MNSGILNHLKDIANNIPSKFKSFLIKDKFASYLTSLFFLVSVILIHFHEMWRDEIQAWLIARSSHNLIDLYHHIRYEGHPGLWHFLLFLVSRFTGNPVAMQFLHVAIATVIVYLVARFAPFSKIQKFLFSFGYFILYEYGTIARNYNITVLLLIIFCVLLQSRRKNYILIGLNLFLLAQTNVFGVIMLPALLLYVSWDFLQNRNIITQFKKIKTEILMGLVLVAVGVVAFYIQVRPPSDQLAGTLHTTDVRNAIATIWQSYAPVPARVINFWNTNFVPQLDQVVIFSVGLLMAATFFFSRNTKILCTYLAGTTGLLAFFYLKNLGGMRHQGFLFIFFVVCTWLVYNERTTQQKTAKAFLLYQQCLLTILLLVQFAGGIVAAQKEHKLTFSNARITASYIQSNKLDSLPIVGLLDYHTSPVIGYLDKQAYYPQDASWGTYLTWNIKRATPITYEEEMTQALRIAREKHSDVLIIAPPIADVFSDNRLKFIAKFDSVSVVIDEKYYLFKLPLSD